MLLAAVEVLTRVTIIRVFLQISLCDIQSRLWHNLAERVRASTKKHCKHVTHLAESMGPLLYIQEDVTLLLLFKLHSPIRLATMAASVVGRHGGSTCTALHPATVKFRLSTKPYYYEETFYNKIFHRSGGGIQPLLGR
jgi:hypothetical protein